MKKFILTLCMVVLGYHCATAQELIKTIDIKDVNNISKNQTNSLTVKVGDDQITVFADQKTSDMVLIRTDNHGNQIWARYIPYFNSVEIPTTMELTPSSELLIGGTTIPTIGNKGVFICKVSNLAFPVLSFAMLTNIFRTPNNCDAAKVLTLPNGNHVLISANYPHTTDSRLYIDVLSPAGAVLTVNTLMPFGVCPNQNGYDDIIAMDAIADQNNNIIICGSVGIGGGAHKPFIAVFDQTGIFISNRVYDVIHTNQNPHVLADNACFVKIIKLGNNYKLLGGINQGGPPNFFDNSNDVFIADVNNASFNASNIVGFGFDNNADMFSSCDLPNSLALTANNQELIITVTSGINKAIKILRVNGLNNNLISARDVSFGSMPAGFSYRNSSIGIKDNDNIWFTSEGVRTGKTDSDIFYGKLKRIPGSVICTPPVTPVIHTFSITSFCNNWSFANDAPLHNIWLNPLWSCQPIVISDTIRCDSRCSNFIITVDTPYCSKFCFTVKCADNSLSPELSDIKWYIGNHHYAENDSQYTFCKKFTVNGTYIIKMTYINEVTGIPGQLTKTITVNTLPCPCHVDSNILLDSVIFTCNRGRTYILSAKSGYNLVTDQILWVLDNSIYAAGVSSVNFNSLPRGHHTLCITIWGYPDGQDDNACSEVRCIDFNVERPDTVTKTITYCELNYPLGPWFNPSNACNGFYNIKKNGVIVGTSNGNPHDNISYLIDNTFEVECIDANGCVLKLIKFNLIKQQVIMTAIPALVIGICPFKKAEYTPICQCPEHGAGYFVLEDAQGTIIAEGEYTGSVVTSYQLALGRYRLTCYNFATCEKCIQDIIVELQYEETECPHNITVGNCASISNQFGMWQMYIDECPDCKKVFNNNTGISNWMYDSTYTGSNNQQYVKLRREIYDDANCKKCILSYDITSIDPDDISIEIEADVDGCAKINLKTLFACECKTFYHYLPEDPTGTNQIITDDNFQICCVPGKGANQVHVFECEDDKGCKCVKIVILRCPDEQVPFMGDPQSSTGDPDPVVSGGDLQPLQYDIIPNPSANIFRIANNNHIGMYDKIEIMDIYGKVIKRAYQVAADYQFNLADESRGHYFVKIITGEEVRILKLVLTD